LKDGSSLSSTVPLGEVAFVVGEMVLDFVEGDLAFVEGDLVFVEGDLAFVVDEVIFVAGIFSSCSPPSGVIDSGTIRGEAVANRFLNPPF